MVNVRELLLLARVPGIGPARLRALVSHFGDPRAVLEASARSLTRVRGIDRTSAQAVVSSAHSPSRSVHEREVSVQLSALNNVGGRIVTFWDRDYPENLKRIYDPPPYLWVLGNFQPRDASGIAIVGTRSPTQYGIQIAEGMSAGLASLGLPVISGLARGIDTAAHRAAVRVGGRTVAVIGSGIDVIYPPENRSLAQSILREGAVVSEFEMGTKPEAVNFPRRNRLVSGIALGVLVVETGPGGGAMITAHLALDQGREVFAIPSPVRDGARSGTNALIREGNALLVESVDDIIAELAPRLGAVLHIERPRTQPAHPDLTLFERTVFDALGETPTHIDDISRRSGLAPSDTLVHLLTLEFKGAVRQMAGKLFTRA
jgi:DNA processing protein